MGKRESRRIVGDHIYSGVDARDSIEFPDSVVIEKRKIDVHYQQKLLGYPVDFKSEAIFQAIKNTYYYIPYRSLYAKDVPNLQMAGQLLQLHPHWPRRTAGHEYLRTDGRRYWLRRGLQKVRQGSAANRERPYQGVAQLCGQEGELPPLIDRAGNEIAEPVELS